MNILHDLIQFPGARISLVSINAIVDETDDEGNHTGAVHIYYGPYNAGLSFEGTAESVMEIIDAYCERRMGA